MYKYVYISFKNTHMYCTYTGWPGNAAYLICIRKLKTHMYCTEYAIFTYAFQVSTYTSQVWFFAMSRMKEDKFTHTLNLWFHAPGGC